MRHQKKGKFTSRDSKARKILSRGLITALVLNGKIKTTVTKAKFLKRVVEKMIKYAQRNPKLARQRLFSWIPNKKVVEKITNEILPPIKKEESGLTKLTRLGFRKGDRREEAQLEWKISPEEKPKEESKILPIKKKENHGKDKQK